MCENKSDCISRLHMCNKSGALTICEKLSKKTRKEMTCGHCIKR